MHLEIVRMVTDQLKQRVGGVNYFLDAERLARDLDTDELPELVAFIGDETRDDEVCTWQEPPALPALYVAEDGLLSVEGETLTLTHRDTLPGNGVAIAIRFITRDEQTCRAVQARGYTLRAIVKSLSLLLDDAAAAATVRNGIQLVGAERFDYGRWREKIGEAGVTGAVVMVCYVRDTHVRE